MEGGRDFDEEIHDQNMIRVMYNSAISKSKNQNPLLDILSKDGEDEDIDADLAGNLDGKLSDIPGSISTPVKAGNILAGGQSNSLRKTNSHGIDNRKVF